MCSNEVLVFLFLVILAMIFFEFIKDSSSTPLDFNTLFRVE
jgi:hypothetical protein